MEGAIAAAVAGILSLIGVIIANKAALKKTRIEQETAMAQISTAQDARLSEIHESITEIKAAQQSFQNVVEFKLAEIEKKQDKYNSVIEKTYKNEKDIAVIMSRGGIA